MICARFVVRGHPSHTADVKRWLLLAGLVGCASGDEPATLPTTFTSASGSASASASASGTSSSDSTTSDESDSDPSDASDPSDPSDTSGNSSGMTSSGSGSTASGSSGDEESEQPEDGMYSACASPVDCIGFTTCLTATDTGGQPIDPFCTDGACSSPLADCQPTPGGTAVPICLEVEIGGVMDSVCALDCSQGQECPAGMDCRTLTGGSICS